MIRWIKALFARWDAALRPVPAPPASRAPGGPPRLLSAAPPPWQPFPGPFPGHPALLSTPARRAALAHHIDTTTFGPAKSVVHSKNSAGTPVVEYIRPGAAGEDHAPPTSD